MHYHVLQFQNTECMKGQNQAQKHQGVKVCSKRLQKPNQSWVLGFGFKVHMQVMMEILASRSEYVRSC